MIRLISKRELSVRPIHVFVVFPVYKCYLHQEETVRRLYRLVLVALDPTKVIWSVRVPNRIILLLRRQSRGPIRGVLY